MKFRSISQNKGMAAVIILAAFLRLSFINNFFYGTLSELFRDLNVIYKLITTGQMVYLGPSASLGGFYFGAGYYYLLAPFVWLFGFRPLGAVFVSALFSILAVLLIYHLLRKWTNSRFAGVLAAFLLAVSVFDIQNAYYISNPNLLPFFLLAFFVFLTRFLEGRNDAPTLLGMGATFGLAVQLHATALISLSVLLVWALFRFRHSIGKKFFLCFVPTLVLLNLPYLIYEVNHDLSNIRRIFFLGGQTLSIIPQLTSLSAVARFELSSLLFSNSYFSLFLHNRMAYLIFAGGFLVLFIAGWFLIKKKKLSFFQEVSAEGKWIIKAWFITGIIPIILFRGSVQPFYFLVLWPLPILLLAILLSGFRIRSPKFVAVFVIWFVLSQGFQLIYFYQISQKQFSKQEYDRVFQAIRSDVGDEEYYALGTSAELDAFRYYSQISGFNKQLTRGSDTLYLLFLKGKEDEIFVPNIYKKERVISSGYYDIVRFRRSK